MARRKDAGHGGGHGWFVTFADLMGLLVSFFVMLVAFSTQDQAKLQVVAGSMRDAFGVQDRVRYSGIIEVLGLPTRPKLRNAAHIDPSEASAPQSAEESDRQRSYGGRLKEDRKPCRKCRKSPKCRSTSCSRRRSRVSTSRLSTKTAIPCFPKAARNLTSARESCFRKLRPSMPYRLSIVGHTASTKVAPKPGYGPWELSADPANAVRQILESEGIPSGNIFMVAGKADTDPLFPDDPYMSPNRRVTVTLMREEPPLPDNLTP